MDSPCALTIAAAALLGFPLSVGAQSTSIASVDSSGRGGNGFSGHQGVSDDGSLVAFHSSANNLVPGDTNNDNDVFLHNFLTLQTLRVSVSTQGVEANNSSYIPSISRDGRYIAFRSNASNLVLNDTNNTQDIFVRDWQNQITTRASTSAANVEANGTCDWPYLSGNGQFVTFSSSANNLVPNDSNNAIDIFVKNLLSGATTRVSVSSSGLEGNAGCGHPYISSSGRYVVFESDATNLVVGDTNSTTDIFLHDLVTSITERVSVNGSAFQSLDNCQFPSVSEDGNIIVFSSDAINLVPGDNNHSPDIFVRNRASGTTTIASVNSIGQYGNFGSGWPRLSHSGRIVTFQSFSDNLVFQDSNGVADIFAHDLITSETYLVAQVNPWGQGNDNSYFSSPSWDGRFVAFTSHATNLVQSGVNHNENVFLRDRQTSSLELSLQGSCPGQVALTIVNAMPGDALGVFLGQPGNTVRGSAPCTGLVLHLSSARLGAIIYPGSSGTATITFNSRAGHCGTSIQVATIPSCTVSGTVTL